jgi:hypothetical protein
MFEQRQMGNTVQDGVDYSLNFVGPGKYFISEAEACKRRGIRLSANAQASGRTWDFGMVPYEPMPYQWMKRYRQMERAHDLYGLCGIMETHHYGFYPSFISKLSKHVFYEPAEPMEKTLEWLLAGLYGEENLPKVKVGFHLWSEAITHYTPTGSDLSGASRVGPAYPFNLYFTARLPHEEEAMFGNLVVATNYGIGLGNYVGPTTRNVPNLRIHAEIASLETMLELMNHGIAVLESIPNKNEKLLSEINLGKYIANCVKTNMHA